MARRRSNKLARRFYGPFKVLQKVGVVAYRLDLPDSAQLHDVFHISKLKRFVGDPNTEPKFFPEEYLNQHPLREPESILSHRQVLKLGRSFDEILVKWKGYTKEEATWEDTEDFQSTFPHFILEDTDFQKGGPIVARNTGADPVLRRSTRATQGKKGNQFEDYVMD